MPQQTIPEKPITNTPGPWTFSTQSSSSGTIAYVKADTGHIEIAVIYDDSGHAGEQVANARLIAAAPELLAVLKEALREATGTDDIGAVVDVLETRGRAAIAKADGR